MQPPNTTERHITENVAGNVTLRENVDFEDRLKSCYEELVRYAWALAGSKPDGDDLLQESLLRAWKAHTKLRQPDRFKHWLIKIISNTHRSLNRRRWLKRMVGLDAVSELSSAAGISFEEKELVRFALGKVPLAQREALVLFEILEWNIKEIAEHQKVTLSAVKSRLARGRMKLKEEYEQLDNLEINRERKLIKTV